MLGLTIQVPSFMVLWCAHANVCVCICGFLTSYASDRPEDDKIFFLSKRSIKRQSGTRLNPDPVQLWLNLNLDPSRLTSAVALFSSWLFMTISAFLRFTTGRFSMPVGIQLQQKIFVPHTLSERALSIAFTCGRIYEWLSEILLYFFALAILD